MKIEMKITVLPILAIVATIAIIGAAIIIIRRSKREILPIRDELRNLEVIKPMLEMPKIEIWEITDPEVRDDKWSRLANIGWDHRGTEV